ncbi:hypothetical protein MNBD_GAMMA15-403 [hydrothermal vent metagenome]|uniref:Uncharacterized protein n=1 Tax=hydrothermal vent metagenome TaxID=652676 RepID=A0A3B0YWX4_9ZZZZ
MNQFFYSLVFLGATQLLSGCGGNVAPVRHDSTKMVSASHSIYLEGGVLKILSNDTENVLLVYIRPENPGKWIASGGGGGSLDKPWLFRSAASWVKGDDNGKYSIDAPRKTFDFIFDSRNLTLKVDSRTYAVRKGDLIVILLDSQWRATGIKSGVEALRRINMPEYRKKHLLNEVKKHF